MKRFALAVVCLALANAVVAQKPPEIELGFKANRVYDFSQVDSVNSFNGNVVIDIPIGMKYPVSSQLSYGLKLVYNSKVWDYKYVPLDGIDYLWAKPNLRSNAGMGWRISLGRLLSPNDATATYHENWNGWLYEGPAGDEHAFNSNAYNGQPQNDPSATVQYTTGDTHLRMKVVSSSERIIEFPTGETHTFQTIGGKWRITKIDDGFLNSITVTYPAPDTSGRVSKWTITDSVGRSHVITFGPWSALNDSVDGGQMVQTIQLSEFPQSPPASAKPYTFEYTNTDVRYGCHHSYSAPVPGAPSGTTTNVPELARLELPDGTRSATT